RGDQLISNYTASNQAEPRGVACIHDLLRRGRVEVRHGFRAEDQRALASRGDGNRTTQFTSDFNRVMRASGNAEPASNAALVHDAHQWILHLDRTSRAHAYAGQARNAGRRVNRENHCAKPWCWIGKIPGCRICCSRTQLLIIVSTQITVPAELSSLTYSKL